MNKYRRTNHSASMTRRQALCRTGRACAAVPVSDALGPLGAVDSEAPGGIDFSEIDRWLQASVDAGTFNGIGLLLCTADETVYKKAFGADSTKTQG